MAVPILGSPVVVPGIYPGPGQAKLLRENCSQWLLQKQLITAGGSVKGDGSNGSASIAVELARTKGSFYPFGVSLQIFFTDVNGVSAAPGSFEVDVQDSDIDADPHYCLLGTAVTAVNGSNSARFESSTLWATYLRAYVKTLTNAVYVSILASR